MRITNLNVRVIVAESGVSYRQIAAQMRVTPEYLSRVMSKPLKPEMLERIMTAMEALTKVKGGVTDDSIPANRGSE